MSVNDKKAPPRPSAPAPEAPAPGPPPVVSPITAPFAEPIGMFPPTCPPAFQYPPGYPYAGMPDYPGMAYPWYGMTPYGGYGGAYGGMYGDMYGGMPCYGMPGPVAPGYGGMPCMPGGGVAAPVVCPRCGYMFGGRMSPWFAPPPSCQDQDT
ncbi:MAG: hypothetical protein ACM3X4_12360 [Ignavibacteriales bacterium]